ncbi:MAG TPA: hypothetical protein VK131_12465, partial [Candidatus Acidoferrales bacterium]|nr:hypothetical protein [Candidatus Acidoferrales bacterium]
MKRRRRPQLWASEKIARQLGYTTVAGVDEVGMGPLAGPVVAGAVVLPLGARLPGLDDSKKLTALQRLRLDRLIRRRAVAVAVCAVEAGEIDRVGLTAARRRATAGAITLLGLPVEYLLVDAWDV